MPVIEIPAELESRLASFSAKTGESADHVLTEAVLTYLEDREDAMIAADRLKDVGTRISLAEIGRKYGLAD